MSKLSRVLLMVLMVATTQGCNLFKKDSGGGGGEITVDDGSGGTVVGNATPTPTPYGLNCDTYNGWDNIQSSAVFSTTAIPGGTISSVTLKLSIRPQPNNANVGTSTTYSTPMTLKVYTCGSGSSLGSYQATANATVGLNYSDKDVTFTFGSPIAVPASGACGANPYPLVFEFGGTANMYMQYIGAQSAATAACPAPFSSGNTAVNPGMRAYNVVISGSP